jgi:hypothetical protein
MQKKINTKRLITGICGLTAILLTNGCVTSDIRLLGNLHPTSDARKLEAQTMEDYYDSLPYQGRSNCTETYRFNWMTINYK